MKIAFYILTFVVCGVAAYFSLELQRKFESQQQVRLETINTNRDVAATADRTEADIENQEAVLDQARQDRAEMSASLESAQATGRTLASQLRDAETDIERQDSEIERLTGELDNINSLFQEFMTNVTPDSIQANITSFTSRRNELVEQREEIEELTTAALRNLADQRDEADRVTRRTVGRTAQLALNATEAVISAVDNNWGFVVIGAGSNSGFSPESAMVVKRDGRVIGRVNPSSIEPTQTIAEIDYDAMSPGVRLQPGDRVMLARPAVN